MSKNCISPMHRLVQPAYRVASNRNGRSCIQARIISNCPFEVLISNFSPVQKKRYADDILKYSLELHHQKVIALLKKNGIATIE